MGFGDWYLPERSRAVTTKNWHRMPPALLTQCPPGSNLLGLRQLWFKYTQEKGPQIKEAEMGRSQFWNTNTVYFMCTNVKRKRQRSTETEQAMAHIPVTCCGGMSLPPAVSRQNHPFQSQAEPGPAAPLGLGGFCVEEPLSTLAESQARLLSFLLPLQQHLCSPEHQEKWVLFLGPICHCPPTKSPEWRAGQKDLRTPPRYYCCE